MNIHIKRILAFFALIVFIATIVKFPAVKNYLFPGQKPTVNVVYSWVGPNEVQVNPFIQSSIPEGYSLYIYKIEPIDRVENGYTLPLDNEWVFVDSTSGLNGEVVLTVNHTEIIEAACVRTGTDPKIAFTGDSRTFDTADTYEFRIDIECH